MTRYRTHLRCLAAALGAAVVAACDDPARSVAPEAGSSGHVPRFSSGSTYESRFRYACHEFTGGGSTQTAANLRILESYNRWVSAFVTFSGAPTGRRVKRGAEDNNDTVSEGQAWGMLLAAYVGDKAVFDDLWRYARHYFISTRDPNRPGVRLMTWHIDQNGQVLGGLSPATDADEDMAMALVVANWRWGGYLSAAQDLINNIMAHEVEKGGNGYVLRPGDWGGSDVTNPSYFAPAYYRVFRDVTGDAQWTLVLDKVYEMIANLNARRGNTNGLLPDWMRFSGEPQTVITNPHHYDYSYNATRVPWRLAKDVAWTCTDARANNQVYQINEFFRLSAPYFQQPAAIRDGYHLTGQRYGLYHNAAFVAPPASSAIASNDVTWHHLMWKEMLNLEQPATSVGAYYSNSLRLLSMLFASGNMANPSESRSAARWLTDFETLFQVAQWAVFKDPASTVTNTWVGPSLVNRALRIDYAIASGGWGGIGWGFGAPRNWSGYRALDFWITGTGVTSGSGACYRLEIQENKNPSYPSDQDTAERWEYILNRPAASSATTGGWAYFDVPWHLFRRRPDWQPEGAPNDGLTMSEVWGVSFAPLPPSQGGTCSSGQFTLDRLELIW